MFYVVLYIFIGIILLLCALSLVFYLCRVFNGNKAGEAYDEERRYGTQYADATLHQTETTPLSYSEETPRQANRGILFGVRSWINNLQNRTIGKKDKIEQVELMDVKKRTQPNHHHQQHVTPSETSPNKPAATVRPDIPIKPSIHSQRPPSSVRNSVVKPSVPPPPPPPQQVAAFDDGNIYQNFSIVQANSYQS